MGEHLAGRAGVRGGATHVEGHQAQEVRERHHAVWRSVSRVRPGTAGKCSAHPKLSAPSLQRMYTRSCCLSSPVVRGVLQVRWSVSPKMRASNAKFAHHGTAMPVLGASAFFSFSNARPERDGTHEWHCGERSASAEVRRREDGGARFLGDGGDTPVEADEL